jgi:hypothetical protein
MKFEKLTEARQRAIDHATLFQGDYRDDFIPWLQENAHVFIEFQRRALQVSRFRDHYSARTIVEVMRHESTIGQLSGDYKINDHATPDMARLFVGLNPDHADLFEFRREKRQERKAA